MVQLIRMRPWYMPMMAPFDRDFEGDTLTTGMDVYEKDGYLFVKAPVPGVPAGEVDVTYTDGQLHVSAHYEENEEDKDKKRVIHQMQRSTSFSYSVTVPTAIDDKSLEAEVKDGVVVIKAKIAEAAKPKKISVKTT